MTRYHRRDEVAGKDVIESEAKKVGVVKDLAYTSDGKAALVVELPPEKGALREGFLLFDKISKIGDVVLIKSVNDVEVVTVSEVMCPNCKSKNPAASKFCFKCGVTLPEKKG